MALLVTLFLVLVNIFNSVTANAPKAEGLTAVETWVVSCIIHVFGVLAEYALILKIIQSEKRRDAKVRLWQIDLIELWDMKQVRIKELDKKILPSIGEAIFFMKYFVRSVVLMAFGSLY